VLLETRDFGAAFVFGGVLSLAVVGFRVLGFLVAKLSGP
jgi:hypothetical protein